MLIIKNKKYDIKSRFDKGDHMTLVVYGDVRFLNNVKIEFEIDHNFSKKSEKFKGLFLMPHYCEIQETTMVLIEKENRD